MTRRLDWIAIVLTSAIKFWLAGARTLEAIGGSWYDDRWFLKMAQSIAAGRWLGTYDYLTLIKGAAYPLFIAFASSIGVPLLFAQQLLYALACLAVVCAVAPVVQPPLARAGMYAVLLFNPMTFADEIATRVTREGFYPALTLLVFAGAAGVVLHRERALRWALLCGVALALFWHTREEGVWIAPLLVIAFIALLLQRRVVIAIVPLTITVAAYGTIIVTNGRMYGVYDTVEFKERSFVRAYASLTHVRQHPSMPRVPVPKEVRERVYAVSPAFAELRPHLEGEIGAGWARTSIPQGKGDIGGAWFMWALRESVAAAGYYARGGAAVRAYYERVSREIAAARVEGRLDARKPRATLVPPILKGQRREIVRTFFDGLLRIPTFRDVTVEPRYSTGSDAELAEFASFTHERLAPKQKIDMQLQLEGWVVHVDGALDIAVTDSHGAPIHDAIIKRTPSPGLYEHLKVRWKDFPPAKHAGFAIRIPSDDAVLVLTMNGRTVDRIPIGYAAPSPTNPDVRMSVDKFELAGRNPKLSAHDALRLRIMRFIARTYRYVFPIITLVALALYIRRARRDVTLLLLGALAAIAARVLILSIIDVTSFFVFTPGYQSPSHALLLAVVALMMFMRSSPQ